MRLIPCVSVLDDKKEKFSGAVPIQALLPQLSAWRSCREELELKRGHASCHLNLGFRECRFCKEHSCLVGPVIGAEDLKFMTPKLQCNSWK